MITAGRNKSKKIPRPLFADPHEVRREPINGRPSFAWMAARPLKEVANKHPRRLSSASELRSLKRDRLNLRLDLRVSRGPADALTFA